jgi:LytS/YehU family sensor histidine kinase
MLMWSGFYFGIKYYQMPQRETEKVLRVTAMAHEAQLKMLRYQLNPHLLFNTLNAISTLILERNTDNANQMVTRLSRFLRYSLDNDPMQRVSLDQELAALQLYLDIEQVRFDERLKVETSVEQLARRALIPSLLQSRLEEAVRRARSMAEALRAVYQKGRLMNLIVSMTGHTESTIESLAGQRKDLYPQRLTIRDGDDITLVPISDIEWIDAAGDYMC